MQLNDVPACEDDGFLTNITNDDNPGTCEINGKRIDLEWSEWDEWSETDDEFNWIDGKTNILIDCAHGGKHDGEPKKRETWLRWQTSEMTWAHIAKTWTAICSQTLMALGSSLNSSVKK